jgi:hypothetical protein
MKLICVIIALTCCSVGFYGQSDMTTKENNIDSSHTQSVELEDLNISLKLSKSWKVKKTDKSKFVVIKQENSKSTISIYLTDPKSILNDILLKTEKLGNIDCKSTVSTDMLVEKLNEINSFPDRKIKISIMSSLIEGDCKVTTTKLIVNNIGLTAIAKTELNCVNCEKESDSIIDSIQKVKLKRIHTVHAEIV